jgi:hypothetical protein
MRAILEGFETEQPTSYDQTADEWCRLIRKLRWIGLDHEAERLQIALRSLPPDERASVIAGPYYTD